MEDRIVAILKGYVKDVEDACNHLLKSINGSENVRLKTKYDFFTYRANSKKMQFETEEMKYVLHGKGCMAFNENIFLDWEFGYRSRWCGIDPWMVSRTLRKNNNIYTEYYDGNTVKEACEQLVADGIMFKRANQYYFKIPENETFKPAFPSEYDSLVIEHAKTACAMPRNKVIDRFIRKSTWVSNEVGKNEDNYILRFLLKGIEVYTIPYDDVSYPENAVKILSDEILKNL